MEILLRIGIVLMAFILTECSAWVNHKYIMHGPMWYFHADHHKKDHDGWFERNDLFFLVYAIPGFLLILTGSLNNYPWYTWIGVGVALYGAAYFLVHDIIIHQRFRIFTRSSNVFILAWRRAHKMHHKRPGKHHGESFGMLFVAPKYFREARKIKAQGFVQRTGIE